MTEAPPLDVIADLAEQAGCDVSALDGREYQTMWCDSDQLQKFVALVRAYDGEHPTVPATDDLAELVKHLKNIQSYRADRDWTLMHLEISEAFEYLQRRGLA